MRKPLASLTHSVAIYGAGDVAVSVVNLLLLPVYIRHLSQEDYGALALLIGVEALCKTLCRWGVDGAFMRYYLDRDPEGRRVLASTLAIFLLAASGGLVTLLLLASPWLAGHLFDGTGYLLPLQIVLVNTFILTFTFFPYQVMRMQGQAITYSAFGFGRSAGTLLLRLVLVVGAGWGLTGLMIADLVVTVVLVPLLWPWYRPLVGGRFSREDLERCLRFGLPRVPHGLAQQALDAGNKYLLSLHVSLAGLGVYQIGMTLGQSLKFFLSAFETGWAPFYYATSRQPDAAVVFRKVTTYGIAVLALLVAGLTATATDLVALIATENYGDAAVVVPIVALGIAWQGVYLLTSIGLNISGKTTYYPVAAFAAAGVGLGAGVVLMPSLQAIGAAIAFALSYVTLALVAGMAAHRHYPVGYETSRILKVVAAAVIAAAAGLAMPSWSPLPALLARGTVVVGVFGGILGLSGFLRPTERTFLSTAWSRARAGRAPRARAAGSSEIQ